MTLEQTLADLRERVTMLRVEGHPVQAASEERAGIPHRPRRGAHGLRRLLAGEVNARTGNAKLAMDAIGDRDIRMADRYLKPREDKIRETFEAMDAGNEQDGEAGRSGRQGTKNAAGTSD